MDYREKAEKIVQEHGNPNEKARLIAGMLPDEEIDRIVADTVFGPAIALGLPMRRKAKPETVRRYAESLGLAGPDDEVHMEILDVQSMSAEEWENAQKLQAAMPEAKVTMLLSVVECGRYFRKSVFAKVEVQIAERTRRLDIVITPERRNRSEERPAARQPEVSYRRSRS